MNLPEPYIATVALHALVLSTAVFLTILCLRKPQRVAVTALCGTLAVAILPWISAMRSQQDIAPDETGSQSFPAMTSLPQWTVVHIPIEEGALPASSVAIDSLAMPEMDPMVAIWAIGALFAAGSLMAASRKIRRWQGTLEAPDDTAWHAIHEAAPELPAPARFRISPADCSPCVTGFLKPVVVIPAFLLAPSKRRELRWAIRHELRHWQGSDSRWTMLLEIVRALQWWNPFVHLLISRWKMAREHICDLAASEDDRATYGEFLISMASMPATRNPLAVTMVRTHRLRSLKTRIVAVLGAAPGTVTRLEKSVVFSACLAFTGAALMISCVRIGDERNGSTLTGSSNGKLQAGQGAPVLAKKDLPKPSKDGLAAQVKFSVKVLVPSNAPPVPDGSVLTEAELQQLMRNYAQKKGTDLMTMPVITSLTGQAAMIEIVNEHPDDPPWQTDYANPQLRQNRYAGWSLLISPSYLGKKIDLHVNIGYGYVPSAGHSTSRSPEPLFEANSKINWKKLVQKHASGQGKLGPGETLAIGLGEVERNRFATVLITAIPIDPTGRELDNYEEALRRRPTVVDRKLVVRGTVLEREYFEQFATGYSGDVPNYSMAMSKKEWVEMKRKLGVKTAPAIELDKDKPVTIPGEDQVAFTGKWYQTEDGIRPSLEIWPRNRKKTSPDRGLPFSLGLSTDTVSVIELKPLKPGMARVLFLEVDPEER